MCVGRFAKPSGLSLGGKDTFCTGTLKIVLEYLYLLYSYTAT